jgi:hypothetical protein
MSAWADGEHHPPFAQTNGAGIEKNVADEICPRCGRRLLSNASIKNASIACHSCACRKSNPNILVVQAAQGPAAKNGPG